VIFKARTTTARTTRVKKCRNCSGYLARIRRDDSRRFRYSWV